MEKRPIDETNVLYYYWLPNVELFQASKSGVLEKGKENKEK